MTILTEIIPPFDTFCKYLNYAPDKCLFFDIETTGLSPSNASVFLIGTIHLDSDQNWILTQYLADTCSEEPQILQMFLNTAVQFDALIHFNGTAFDLPFLTARAKKYHIPCALEPIHSIDLYQKLRPLKNLYLLEHLNQTSLESFLGWKREDRLTGKHMISLYQTYTASGESKIRNLLLLHNHDDMIGMTRLLSLTAALMLADGILDEPALPCFLSDSLLQLQFQLTKPLPVSLSLTKELAPDIALTLSADQNRARITIPIFCSELKYFFKDYKNYYYLPLEDQAIHKSVGAFVDKDLRQNARPSTCYIRRQGIFLPQPEPLFEPAFQTCFEAKLLYFEYTEATARSIPYIRSLLKWICR